MTADVVRISVLGPIAAARDGQPIQLGGRMQRALFAALIARHPVQVGTSRISDDLWGDDQPPSAQGTIYAYVSRLRKALGSDAIVKDGDGYRLNLPGSALDATEFTKKIDRAAATSANDPEAAAIMYRDALLLWRGERDASLIAGQVGIVEGAGRSLEVQSAGQVETCQTSSNDLPRRGRQGATWRTSNERTHHRMPLRHREVGPRHGPRRRAGAIVGQPGLTSTTPETPARVEEEQHEAVRLRQRGARL